MPAFLLITELLRTIRYVVERRKETNQAPTQQVPQNPITHLALFFTAPEAPTKDFTAIIKLCEEAGFTPVLYPHYPHRAPQWIHRRAVKGYMEKLRWQQPTLERVLLIGHGKGGLLARTVIEEQCLPSLRQKRCVALITLGTRHQSAYEAMPDGDKRFWEVCFLNLIGMEDEPTRTNRSVHPEAGANEWVNGTHETLLAEIHPKRDHFITKFLKNFFEHSNGSTQPRVPDS